MSTQHPKVSHTHTCIQTSNSQTFPFQFSQHTNKIYITYIHIKVKSQTFPSISPISLHNQSHKHVKNTYINTYLAYKKHIPTQRDKATERDRERVTETHLCTDSLNFSSSRNWRMRNTNSLLKDDIFPNQKKPNKQSPNFQIPQNPPTTKTKTAQTKRDREKKASKPTKETTQLSPNHTLQAQKCSKQPYILRNSSSFRRFLSSDSEVSRVSKAADKRERERERERDLVSLSSMHLYREEAWVLSLSTDLSVISPLTYLICSNTYCICSCVLISAWVISQVKDRERVFSGIETTHSNLVNIRFTRPVVSYPNFYLFLLFFSHCRFRFFIFLDLLGEWSFQS